jgi:PAS domain S-box-containing protein
VNQQFCDLFGIEASPEALIGTYCRDAEEQVKTIFADSEGFITRINTILATGKPVQNEELNLRDGRVFELDYVSMELEPGRTEHLWHYSDVSEHKKTEKEMRKSEKYYKMLFNLFPFGVEMIDTKGNIVDCSPSTTQLLGYNRSELIGKHISELLDSDSLKTYINKFPELMKGKQQEAEVKLVRQDGVRLNAIRVATPIINEQGTVTGAMTVTVDINERAKAEQTIRDNEQRLYALINSTPDIICFKDGQGRWLVANDADLELFSLNDVDYYGKTDSDLAEFTDPIYREVFLTCEKSDEKAWQSGGILRREEVIPKADGTIKVYDVIKVPVLESDGTRKGLVVLGRDITQRKRAEEDLRLALIKAQESDRLKSAFLANMSHEIRTPLNGILGFMQLIQDPETDEDNKKLFKTIIDTSSRRLIDTINSLIDISKIEAGMVEVYISPVSVNDLINELHSFFKPQAEMKDITVIPVITLPKNEATILTDRDKIFAILSNLIKNAIKFTDKGKITFGCQRKNDHIEFFIEDTGIGIPADRSKVIFDRFTQADYENKRVFEGSGLGLSIAKEYVKLLGGDIWFLSKEKNGTTFYFTIPYKTKAIKTSIKGEIEKKEMDSITDSIRDLSVLIAEDEESATIYLKELLKEQSKKLIFAKTGREAVELCRMNPDVNLVLMDIRMPDMDGYAATREIRKFNKKVIIIAQTAYALEGDREKALGAGCNDYISKPFEPKKLFAVIEKNTK